MYNNRQIKISIAGSRKATKWQTQQLWWSEFVERLAVPVRSPEPLSEYLRYPKSKQDDLKDVGGYVGGELIGGLRKANSVAGRDLITLDMDSIPVSGTSDILRRVDVLGCAFAVYSTRKHEEYKPRLRVIIPLSRTVTPDEYEPAARMLASLVGMQFCDPSTFEASRLMYWPSASADSQYIYTYADKPFANPDGVLAMYKDWRDYTQWPQVPGVQDVVKTPGGKQADPTTKPGIIGAFCRVYDIYRVMSEILPGTYETCDIGPERYTYTGGSTTGGAVVYENGLYLYSHHATDPAAGKLCNAFDLVRYHLYGKLDDEAKPDTPTNKLPSYMSMCKHAVADSYVAALLNKEHYDEATSDFNLPAQPAEDVDLNWIKKLQLNSSTGKPECTRENIRIILEHDPLLRGKLGYDAYAHRYTALGALPWNQSADRRMWVDVDDAGVRHYLEKTYTLAGKEKIEDAVALVMHKHQFNELREYLSGVTWDGVPRVDTLLIDYFGAEDNIYSREVIRKALTAAVARVMDPGVKFDTMTIITGPQGTGKSTFLAKLGRKWFSDSLCTFEGKEAYELIQGKWIIEVSELNAMNKSEFNAVKQFLSKQVDSFRVAYGHRVEDFPRGCVFFGTTNEAEFLRDATGDRRFWPVDSNARTPTKDVFRDLDGEVDQIWAEAMYYWQSGEPLILSDSASVIAKRQQKLHKESNAKEGLIRDFLDKRVPEDWSKRSVEARRVWWGGEFDRARVTTWERDRVCAVEIYTELFGGDAKMMKRQDTVEINGILANIEGWKRFDDIARFGPYGFQRGYYNDKIDPFKR